MGLVPGPGVVRGRAHLDLHALKYMILTGEPLDARQALAAGLVNEVVPAGAHLAKAEEWAATIAARSPTAVAAAKDFLSRGRLGPRSRTPSTRSPCCRGAPTSPRASPRSARSALRHSRAGERARRRPRVRRSPSSSAAARRRSRMGGAERIARHHASGRLTARERLDALDRRRLLVRARAARRAELRRPQPAPGRRRRRRPRADRRPQGLRDRGRRDRARRHDRPGQHAQAEPGRALGGRARAAADLPERQRRRPDPRRDGLALLRPPVRLPDVRRRRPRAGRRCRASIAVLGASFGDSALHAAMGHFVVMTQERGDRALGPAGDRGRDRRGADRRGARRPEGRRPSGAATPTSSSTTSRRRWRRSGARSPTCPTRRRCRRRPRRPPHPPRDAEELPALVPREPRRGYDMRKVLEAIFDAGSAAAVGRAYGPSVLCALGRGSRARRSASSPASRCSAPA